MDNIITQEELATIYGVLDLTDEEIETLEIGDDYLMEIL